MTKFVQKAMTRNQICAKVTACSEALQILNSAPREEPGSNCSARLCWHSLRSGSCSRGAEGIRTGPLLPSPTISPLKRISTHEIFCHEAVVSLFVCKIVVSFFFLPGALFTCALLGHQIPSSFVVILLPPLSSKGVHGKEEETPA